MKLTPPQRLFSLLLPLMAVPLLLERTTVVPPPRVALPLPPLQSTGPAFSEEVAEYAGQLQTAYRLETTTATTYAGYILESAAYSGVPRELLAALIQIESHFRDDAVSAVGAVGPAQIMPAVWGDACGDVHEPRSNVLCAGVVLSHYKHDFCEGEPAPYACALSLYNVGPGTLRREPVRGLAAASRYLDKMAHSLGRFDDPLTMVPLSPPAFEPL